MAESERLDTGIICSLVGRSCSFRTGRHGLGLSCVLQLSRKNQRLYQVSLAVSLATPDTNRASLVCLSSVHLDRVVLLAVQIIRQGEARHPTPPGQNTLRDLWSE